MFKKLVSGLPFSPALVGSLGYYSRQLKKEQSIRKLGVIFTILTLAVQVSIILWPAEAANTANAHDTIFGGVSNINQIITSYDSNSRDLKSIASFLGISREDISVMKKSTNIPSGNWIHWSHDLLSNSTVTSTSTKNGDMLSYNSIPFGYHSTALMGNSLDGQHEVYLGHSEKIGSFAIAKNNGDFFTKNMPSSTYATGHVNSAAICLHSNGLISDINSSAIYDKSSYNNCNISCSDNQTDPNCPKNIERNLTAINLTQNTAANKTTAEAGDRIQYILLTRNTGKATISIDISNVINDIREYALILDNGGGKIDTTQSGVSYISWNDNSLKPGEETARTFTVKVLDPVPLTARGVSNPSSYDCILENTYGVSNQIKVACPSTKHVERIIEQLPPTSATIGLLFMTTISIVTIYLYIRSAQLYQEVKLVRKDFNSDTSI
ncbi:MAG: hypothetical protein WAW60_01890 [Candidatus Saccharimonadales bacterium]